MPRQFALTIAFGLFGTLAAQAQSAPVQHGSVPIYRVTVVERTVKAVHYEYRNGPTRVDFRGTVLLPKAKGDATVESKQGRTEIEAHFDRVEAPTRYGGEYLTYVLWAVTPEGHAKNLGEVLAGSGDSARLHVTTDLQAFGMIVTAEPYSAVRQPSDVVVMENEIRPDTVGHIGQIQAKYELLPRGEYTYNAAVNPNAATGGPMVSMDRYEQLVEVYQAQNAVQIARAAGADRYAPDTMARAQKLLDDARRFEGLRADRTTVVTAARASAQTAEDARIIAVERAKAEQLADARDQARIERDRRLQAEAEAQTAKAQASADRMMLESERNSREIAQTQAVAAAAAMAAARPAPAPVSAPVLTVPPPPPPDKTAARVRLLQDLNSAMSALDTPRGLVVTLPDADFQGAALSPAMYSRVARLASILAAHPSLYVVVEGNCDNPVQTRIAEARAISVKDALVRAGAPSNLLAARNLGASRPIASNASGMGRLQNRRVEITISGPEIGSMAYWDRPYSLK